MAQVYNYSEEILARFPDLSERQGFGTTIPSQVEIHLPSNGSNLCWLSCPHCFTDKSSGSNEKISTERLIEVIGQIAGGSPKTSERPEKIVFAGFETDPLNSGAIEDVVRVSKEAGFIIGIHTKALLLKDGLVGIITDRNMDGDYFSVSVDAGSNDTYDLVHGLAGRKTRLYGRILMNVDALIHHAKSSHSPLQIRATYLLTSQNSNEPEVLAFVKTFLDLGVDSIKFAVPVDYSTRNNSGKGYFPNASAQDLRKVEGLISELAQSDGRIYLMNENEMGVLPCYSRWLKPTIGYDGYLYPCCSVAGPDFKSLRIADLKVIDFWDGYYRSTRLDYEGARCQCTPGSAEVNKAAKLIVLGNK